MPCMVSKCIPHRRAACGCKHGAGGVKERRRHCRGAPVPRCREAPRDRPSQCRGAVPHRPSAASPCEGRRGPRKRRRAAGARARSGPAMHGLGWDGALPLAWRGRVRVRVRVGGGVSCLQFGAVASGEAVEGSGGVALEPQRVELRDGGRALHAAPVDVEEGGQEVRLEVGEGAGRVGLIGLADGHEVPGVRQRLVGQEVAEHRARDVERRGVHEGTADAPQPCQRGFILQPLLHRRHHVPTVRAAQQPNLGWTVAAVRPYARACTQHAAQQLDHHRGERAVVHVRLARGQGVHGGGWGRWMAYARWRPYAWRARHTWWRALDTPRPRSSGAMTS
eukprot:scaffold34592_cov63-Phaeocystis_antarctica.AAC.6